MNIREQKLLLEYARLMLRISIAQKPLAVDPSLTEKTVHRSAGYHKLRAFYVKLNPRKREAYARQIRAQCEAVASLLKQAAATGEEITLGDVTIEIYDAETRAPITADDAPRIEGAEPPAQEQPT